MGSKWDVYKWEANEYEGRHLAVDLNNRIMKYCWCVACLMGYEKGRRQEEGSR